MANQKRMIDYEIQFRTNQQSLQNVNKVFRQFFDNFKFSDLQLINNSTKTKATKDLLEIRETANTVEAALTAAFNPKLGITNIDTFKNNLKAAGTSIEQVRAAFDKAGGAGTQAFQAMTNSLTNVRLKATESESIIDKMGETLKRTLTWSVSSSIINKMAGSIQEAYGYVKHLDSSLNDIRIVTEYSAEAMDKFAEKANKAAITLGKSTTDYTEAALIYYQQGLGEEDVAARTDVTLKTANVTQQSTAQVSEELTAIWNGYKANAEEAEAYIDKVAKVAAITAADLEEMATGMSKVASAANVMGVDIDQMNAILATTISVTRQAPESVGAAYKTIFARMSQIQAGEETDDGATLKSYTEQMAAMGISVLDANNKLRDMGDIIEEVGNKWQTWGREQQIAFAQVAAGTRQYNNLIALFDNWGMYEKTLEESKNALGTLQTQQDIYMESTAAHLQQLRTAAEGIYDSLINAKDINSVVDVFTGWAKGIETIVDGLGGLKGVLGVIGPLMINAFSSNIGQIMSQTFSNFTIKEENLVKVQQLEASIQNLKNLAPETTQKYLQMKESLAGVASGIKPELFNKISDSIEKQAAIESEINKINTDIENNSKRIAQAKREIGDAAKRQEEREILINQQKEEQLKLTQKLRQANLENAEAAKKQLEELNTIYRTDSAGRQHLQSTAETEAGLRALGIKGRSSAAHANRQKVMAELNSYGITDESLLKGSYAEIAEKINNAIKERKKLLEDILKSEEKIENIKKMMPQLSDEEVNKLAEINDLEIEGKNLEEAKVAIQKRLQTEQAELLKLQREGVRLIGEGIGQAASAITGFIGAFDQIKNVFKILDNDDLTTLEKFKQALAAGAAAVTALMMAFGTAGRAISSFRSAAETLQKVQKALNTSTTLQEALTKLNTKAEQENSTAKIENAGATGADAAAKEADTIITGQEKVVIDAETTSILANKMARLGLIAVIGLAAIAIAAYTAYVLSGAKAERDLQKEVEKANKAYEKQKEVLQEVKEKQENLNNLVDTYKEQKKALDDLVKGTEEWNNQMDSLSETVDQLLEEYPELIKYATYNASTGTYSIDESKLEEFQKKQEEALKQQQIETDKAALANVQTQIKEIEFKQQKYGGYLDELNKLNDQEIGLRRKLNNELMTEADKKKAEGDLDAYQVAVYNTQKREDLGTTTKEDAIYNVLVDQVFKDWRSKGINTDYDAATLLGLAAGSVDEDYDFSQEGKVGVFDTSMASFTYYDYKDFINTFIESEEEREKLFIDYFTETNTATARVLQDNLNANLTTLEELSLNQLQTLATSESIIHGEKITQDTINELQNKRKKQYFGNNQAESRTYDTLISGPNAIKGIGDASPEELDQLAQKIAEAYKTGGLEGVYAFEEEWANKPLKKVLEVEITDSELNKIQSRLAEANISQFEFDETKKVLGDKYDDEQIANYLIAQEQINHIFENREKIFKELSNYDGLNKTHVKDLESLSTALSQLFGREVSSDFILQKENLQLIKDFFDTTKETDERQEAMNQLVANFNKLESANFSEARDQLEDLFLSYTSVFESGAEIDDQDFINKVIELATKIGYDNDQIKELFADWGYIQQEDGTYIKEIPYKIEPKITTIKEDALKQEYVEYVKSMAGKPVKAFEQWYLEQGYKKRLDGLFVKIIYESVEVEAVASLTGNTEKDKIAAQIYRSMAAQGLDESTIKQKISEICHVGLDQINANYDKWTVTIPIDAKVEVQTDDASPVNIPKVIDTYTAQTIKEVYKPKLDTSDIDRGLERIQLELDEAKEASKFLSGDALVANLQQQIDLETQLLEKKKEKITREEQYQRETASAYNDQMAEYNSKLATAEKTSGQSFGVNIGFAYDSEGFIKNLNEIDKAYFDKEQKIEAAMEGADDNTKAALTDQLNIIKSARSEVSNYVSAVNGSREKSLELMKEEAKYAKTVAELEQQQAMAGADRTAATTSQLADLEYQAEKTSKALEALGDAGDLSGTALVKYNDTRIGLLEQQEKEAEEKQKILAEERQRLLGDAENANSLMGQANKLGVDVQFREDGSVDLEAMKADWQEIQDSQKYSNEELAEMGRIWQVIEKYGKNYNSNLDENNKSIEDWVKYSKEIARLSASKQYAEINAELEDAAKKAGILKQNLEHAKAVFDKAGDNKKNFVKGYIESLEEYDKVQEAVLKRSAERFEKLKQDWNPQSDTTALSAAFNAEDADSFMAVYSEAQLELIELDKELESSLENVQERMKNFGDITEENKEDFAKLKAEEQEILERQKQLEKSTDDLADKYEHLSSKTADMSQVADLSKEWKTAAVDREIKKVNRELSLLQKQQSRLKGKDVIANLQQQVAVIQKQINLEKNKLKILQAQAQTQREVIQETITGLQLQGLGSAFDSSGHVNAAFLDKLAKKADLSNDAVQMLISALKDYESIMNEIESQQDAIVGLQDEIADKQYEISEKIYEETRKEAQKLLNRFKIEIEVELNEADMLRKLERLKAKVAKMPAWDLSSAMLMEQNDAISYATKDVQILTGAIDKLIGDYASGAWKDFYDTQKDAYDDIIGYANQLESAVNSFYEALENARQKYAEAIDNTISSNQQLINDLEYIKKLSQHGINITKMLFGENGYDEMVNYYDKISDVTKKQLATAKDQAAYYGALLQTIDPLLQPDQYKAVAEAQKSAMDEVYSYGEALGQQALEEMNAKIDSQALEFKKKMADVAGYASPALQDIARDSQQRILKDYLDSYESEYEMITLQNKFTKAIEDTDDAAAKSKLTEVMKEQVGYLQKQVDETGRLTKYEVDRANMMYDLTLKQMALEEAKDNKSKMRLRRDSQGNYRYEYVADTAAVEDAEQDLLDIQHKLYELDKQRMLELQEHKIKLQEEYLTEYKKIATDEHMTEQEKLAAIEELNRKYGDEMKAVYSQINEDLININESSAGNLDIVLQEIIKETGDNAQEIADNLVAVQDAVDVLTEQTKQDIQDYADELDQAIALMTNGLGDLEAAIDMDISAILDMLDVDNQMIEIWMEQVDVCGDLMAQLQDLEDSYRGVMQAALDAYEAAAKLKVTDFSTADERKDTLTGNASAQGAMNGNSAMSGGVSSKTSSSKDKKATIQTEVLYLDGVPIHMTRPELSDMAGTGKWSQDGYNALYSKHPELQGLTQSPDLSGPTEGYKQYGKLTKKKITLKFDTGGYTGEWGADGRLAMLHQKELVLNAKDTENFLKAADVMRTLQNNIEQIQNYVNTMSPSFNISAPSSDLNQNVKIEASFPGVTNSREIEDAFNNLVNLASQRAMSTRR